jgi:hypothetical protein
VVTLDPRPLLSRTVTAHVSVRVSFHVHSSARRGIVRMYGTVSPALVGARVLFQLQKAVRPGSRGLSEKAEERAEERGETPGMRFATQASTVVKRGTRSFARFSLIVKVKRTGRYRALVIPRRGALVSGFSQTIVVHAAPSRRRSAR